MRRYNKQVSLLIFSGALLILSATATRIIAQNSFPTPTGIVTIVDRDGSGCCAQLQLIVSDQQTHFYQYGNGYGNGSFQIHKYGSGSVGGAAFTILKTGYVGIGTSSPLGLLHTVTSGTANAFYHDAFGTGQFPLIQARSARGSSSSPAGVANGDITYDIRSQGYTGASGYANVGIIRFTVDGGVGSAITPGRITFHTGDGAGGVPERLRIDSNGNVGIGTTNPGTARMFLTGNTGNAGNNGFAMEIPGLNYGLIHFGFGTTYDDYIRSGPGGKVILQDSGGGNVGIAIGTPNAKLYVGGGGYGAPGGANQSAYALGAQSIAADASIYSYGAICSGNAAGNCSGPSGVVLGINNTAAAVNIPNSGNITFNNGGNVGIGKPDPSVALDVVGSINVTGNINAKYQDVAEWVPSSEKLAAGTVVVLDATKSNQVTSSSTAYDTRVAGVISAQPGITLGEKSEDRVLVATTGRVRVKVDATKAPINIGDLLVTSDLPGVAMKSEAVNLGGVSIHRPGTIIGKALEPLAKGKGEILVLLSLQ